MWFVFAVAILSLRVAHSFGADTVVVRPAGWSWAIQDWKKFRESQGHSIAEIDSAASPVAIANEIRKLDKSQPSELKYVLLASDVEPLANQQVPVPVFYQRSSAMVQLGGEPVIATDNGYADLNDDQLPDLAVGRIPADSPQQLQQVLQRTIQYENSDVSRWRRNVHVVAGVGGFGVVADNVIELTTRQFLSRRIPGWADLSMTHASPMSPFCPDPWKFSEITVSRLNEGSMFWVYIGHGHVKTLDYLNCNNEFLPILTREHVGQVDVGQHSPIAIFLACYTGAFDASEDSLAESLILHERGPVAALAASRVSGPYGLAMLSDGLLSYCFEDQMSSFGQIVMKAKRDLFKDPNLAPADGVRRANANSDEAASPSTPEPTSASESNSKASQLQLINSLASALSPQGHDLAAERLEHVWMMNLIGDPLLKLNQPSPITIRALSAASPGGSIQIDGLCPIAGQLTLELAYRRDQLQPNLPKLNAFSKDPADRELTQNKYLAANRRVISLKQLAVNAGDFSAQVTVPTDLLRGPYCIRAFAESNSRWATGYQTISIRSE